MQFTRSMGGIRTIIFVSVAFALSACGYVRTTYVTTNDALTEQGEGPDLSTGTPGQQRLNAARQVFNRCVSCHATYPTQSEGEWISSNLIVPRNSASSFLLSKIRGSGVNGSNDMPADGSNLSSAQIQAIKAWIDGLP
jgi:mono/diheme cytochrome c family protein